MLDEYAPALRSHGEADDRRLGRYVYGVVRSGGLGNINLEGIEGNPVHFIESNGVAAVVHDHEPMAYDSKDTGTVTAWVEAHNRVLATCLDVLGTVIPYTFNTIVYDPRGEKEPDAVMREWLDAESNDLRALLARLEGKAEYGVQVILDLEESAHQITAFDEEIRTLSKETSLKQGGTAYMLRRRLERLMKQRLEAKASQAGENLLNEIQCYCFDIRLDKNRRLETGKAMILNLSCLAAPEGSHSIGTILDEIARHPEYEVRFTGPWPPYSFVNRGDRSHGIDALYARHTG